MAATNAAAAKQAPAAPAVRQESPIALMKRTVADAVAKKVDEFIKNREIDLPASYSVGNALKAAWLILQETVDRNKNKALDVCTKDSIANAMLDMVVQGLNPIKNQVYFIVYGKTLTAQRSYFGSMAVAKMVQPEIDEFAYAAVYDGDTFKYSIKNGKKTVVEHEQEFGNVDKKNIVGAYAIALDKAGDPIRSEIMTIAEIKQAWDQSPMHPVDAKGEVKADSTHGKFTADMAQKTVVNKLCKQIVNASSDKALLLERMNRAADLSDRAEAEAEIEEQANTGEVLDITPEPAQIENTKQEDAEEMAPGPCPDKPEVTYLKSHCDNKCAKRKGCPAWPIEEKETTVKTKERSPGF
ncbi:MAG: RecT family recombinase [Desulfosalsimonadaceae bacterium]